MPKYIKLLRIFLLIFILVVVIVIWQWDFLVSHNALGPVLGALIGIFGAIAGASLGSTLTFERSIEWQEKENRKRREKNKELIINEVKMNYDMIEGKRNGINHIITALRNKKLPLGWEVKFFKTAYSQYITDADLTSKERNALHVIYECQIIYDDFIYNLEKDLLANLHYASLLGYHDVPYGNFVKKANYQERNLAQIEKLIKNFLDGKPDDTFDYITEE